MFALKGTGFSPYVDCTKSEGVLAPEACFTEARPQLAEAAVSPGGSAVISYALPPESSRTPFNCLGVAVRLASFFRSRIRPFAVGVSFCGAGLSRMS